MFCPVARSGTPAASTLTPSTACENTGRTTPLCTGLVHTSCGPRPRFLHMRPVVLELAREPFRQATILGALLLVFLSLSLIQKKIPAFLTNLLLHNNHDASTNRVQQRPIVHISSACQHSEDPRLFVGVRIGEPTSSPGFCVSPDLPSRAPPCCSMPLQSPMRSCVATVATTITAVIIAAAIVVISIAIIITAITVVLTFVVVITATSKIPTATLTSQRAWLTFVGASELGNGSKTNGVVVVSPTELVVSDSEPPLNAMLHIVNIKASNFSPISLNRSYPSVFFSSRGFDSQTPLEDVSVSSGGQPRFAAHTRTHAACLLLVLSFAFFLFLATILLCPPAASAEKNA